MQVVTCDSPAGRLGLSTCYDLRFPHLYQRLVLDGGARLLLVPSAFTRPTGAPRPPASTAAAPPDPRRCTCASGGSICWIPSAQPRFPLPLCLSHSTLSIIEDVDRVRGMARSCRTDTVQFSMDCMPSVLTTARRHPSVEPGHTTRACTFHLRGGMFVFRS